MRPCLSFTVVAAALVLGCSDQAGSSAGPNGAGTGGSSSSSSSSGSGASSSASSGPSAGGGGSGGETPVSCNGDELGDSIVELSHPECDGGCGAAEMLGIAVGDAYVFACSAQRGLVAIDRTAPGKVRSQTMVNGQGRCQHVALDGTDVLVSNRGDAQAPKAGIALIDVSHPEGLGEGTSLVFHGESPEGLAVVRPGLYAVAMHGDGVAIIAKTSGTLEEVARVGGLVNALAVQVAGDRLYVADGDAGVGIIDISEPKAPALLGHTEIVGSALQLSTGAGTLFVAAGSAGVHLLSLADPDHPALLSTFDTPGAAVEVAYHDGFLSVADWNDLRVLDVHDKSAPRLVGAEAPVSGMDFPRVLAVDAVEGHTFIGEWTGVFDYEVSSCLLAPDIRVPVQAVQFGKTQPGAQAAYSLVLGNEGAKPLEISSITAEGSGFEVLGSSLSIPPGGKDFVELRFTATDMSKAIGKVVLVSDDPDEGRIEVPLVGNGSAWAVGDPIPDWEFLPIGAGSPIRTTALQGSIVVLSYFATF